ncbi:hypothetical protein OPKNFCMD_4619 [Methylobacterium crusticola]|uniref:DUF2735 domain-containing protein n=1 Tax=Methylobacterium crusticola TaxID=1697972 RepID=A0ABQ4R419_9HYPH|nr:DUF2735 domain-containing protein [Methylobacterium crusticola]GJD51860.1 hypothetical protein OPKNFCMD_4619 [Methylobacterium crusticola]
MTTEFRRESAKIYAFPARYRAQAGGHRDATRGPDQKAERGLEIMPSRCGYHEAAIQEAERARKP